MALICPTLAKKDMELKDIQNLIKFVSAQKVDEVEIEQKDFKIIIKKNLEPHYTTMAPQVVHMPSAAPAAVASPSAPTATPTAAAPAAEDNANYVTIKSPMVGTFYRSANPESPVFANVGDEIGTGKVVCIIEAMKLFNEIESEVKGKIVKVLVDNASPVEYDQPLFLVDPS
jgi:acetyl-CoA carboxylase biotin carboxyl carrier protein